MDIKKDLVPLLKDTWTEFQQDEAGQRGAALSYYAMFSIFPLLLLLLAIFGLVVQYTDAGQDARTTIISTVSRTFGSTFGSTLSDVLDVVAKGAGSASLVGLITLLMGASGVFQQLDLTLNKMWGVERSSSSGGIVQTVTSVLRDRLIAFGMVLSLGLLLVISLALTVVTQTLNSLFEQIPLIGGVSGVVFGIVVALLLNTLIVALIFRYLPRTDVQWRDVWPGAVLTAVIWEIAKRLLALYIGGSSYASAYGLVGSVLVLMAWIYFTSQVLFLGAEFTQVYTRYRRSRAVQSKQAEQELLAELAYPYGLPAPSQPQPSDEPQAMSETKKVAVAAGAGLALGVLGALVTSLVVAVRAVRSVAGAVARRTRR